jgi:hypothetical protein
MAGSGIGSAVVAPTIILNVFFGKGKKPNSKLCEIKLLAQHVDQLAVML